METAVAIMGYGVVGSGVAEVLTANAKIIANRSGGEIKVKRILDLRDFNGEPFADKITHNFEDILNDTEIEIVVEAMGGLEPAFAFTKELLSRGKNVVTSNKELVAKYGTQLLQTAKQNGVNYLFEASVCGGIPVLRAISGSLTGDRLNAVTGIFNGTTNYILTKMTAGGDYQTALIQAQELGYAERNPAADVLGFDPCRKLAIILSLMTGKFVDSDDIYTEGITHLTPADFMYAKHLDCSIKLLAAAEETENGLTARVAPAFVSKDHPLSTANDVYNAVCIQGEMADDIMLYGRGAGQLPTGSAVVSDIVDIVRNKGRRLPYYWSEDKQELVPHGKTKVKRFIRAKGTDRAAAQKTVSSIFNIDGIITLGNNGPDGEFAFITELLAQEQINSKLIELTAAGVTVLSTVIIHC